MKTKLIGLLICTVILNSCGLTDEEKKKKWLIENINTNHLEAYLNNNSYDNLIIHNGLYKGDSVSILTNDMFILNQLHEQGKFIGADKAYTQLYSALNNLNTNPEYINDDMYMEYTNLISKSSNIEFIYFLVYRIRGEDGSLKFVPFPFVDDYTGNNKYYNDEIVNLINNFGDKVNEGKVLQKDTLVQEIQEPDFLGDEISAEVIVSLTMNQESISKKETRKGQDKTSGEYFTSKVDELYSGKQKSRSKIIDCSLDANSNIYVAEDVDYVSNYDFSDRFPESLKNIKRIRLRKFDVEGVQIWTFCGLSCNAEETFKNYGDLSFLSKSESNDTLFVIVYEGNHSFSFSNYNGLNKWEVDKHLIKINANNGKLYSFSPVSNEIYREYSSKKTNANKKVSTLKLKNILNEPYHVYRIGNSKTLNFYKSYEFSDCDCIID